MKTIILYTSERCHYCDDVNTFLDAFFLKRKNPFTITKKDIGTRKNRDELTERMGGQLGVPAMIADKKLLIGSDVIIDWFKRNT